MSAHAELRLVVFLGAACSGSERDLSSSVGACDLENVDAVCAAPVQSVTANASIAIAPDVIAGITYVSGPGSGERGYVIFTPTISGSRRATLARTAAG